MNTPEQSPIDFSTIVIRELPRSHTSRSMKFGATLAAMGLIGAAFYTTHAPEEPILPAESTTVTDFHDNGTYEYFAPQAPKDPTECAPATPADIAMVSALFDIPAVTTSLPDVWNADQVQEYEDFYAKTAPSMFGVRLLQPIKLQKLNLYDPSVSFNTVLRHTQEYLQNYGIDISLMTSKELTHHTYMASTVPSKQELENTQSKLALINIANGIAQMPVDYVKKFGPKRILLVTNGDGFAGLAESGPNEQTVLVSIDMQFNHELIQHEFMHIYDTNQCGNPAAAFNDPSYTAFNKRTIYNVEYDDLSNRVAMQPRPVSYESISSLTLDDDTSIADPIPCDLAIAAQREARVPSDYAYTNVVEDKAETGKLMFNRFALGQYMSERTPIIRQKLLTLLARLYHQSPATAEYLIGVAERPKSYDPFCSDEAQHR